MDARLTSPSEEAAGEDAAPLPCRIGLWGTFDIEHFGDALSWRIARHELLRRLPDATVRVFAPYGRLNPTRFDGGEPAEPLGAWTEGRALELADELDCVLVGEGEIAHTRERWFAELYGAGEDEVRARAPGRFFIEGLGAALEERCPVLWHGVRLPFNPTQREAAMLRESLPRRPYVSVGDEVSRERLRLVRADNDVEVVPDSAVLARRFFERGVLEKRLAYLRMMQWFPSDGEAVVVQADRKLVRRAVEVAAALSGVAKERNLAIVLVEASPAQGDGAFADALSKALPGNTYRLPAEVSVEDIAAAISAATFFVGTSRSATATALGLGRAAVALNLDGRSGLDGLAGLLDDPGFVATSADDLPRAFEHAMSLASRSEFLDSLRDRVDAHFDRMAEIARDSAARRRTQRPSSTRSVRDLLSPRERFDLLRRAHEARGERLAAERVAFADRLVSVRAALRDAEDERRRLQDEVDWLEQETANLKDERDKIRTEELGWLKEERDKLKDHLVELEAQVEGLRDERRRIKEEEIPWLNRENRRLKDENVRLTEEFDRLAGEIERLKEEVRDKEASIERFYASPTWRLTKPLRAVGRVLLRPVRRLRRRG